MKIYDIYQLEIENQNCCYLIKDGIFWRAWERSAMQFCVNIKPYQVTKKRYKVINDFMVFIGFPDNYLNIIIQKCKELNLEAVQNGNTIKIIGFKEKTGFDEWKNKIQETHSSVAEINQEYNLSNHEEKIRNVIPFEERVRQFPLAGKTPIECQQFLYELQNQLNGTL
jgi:hypothetical protein